MSNFYFYDKGEGWDSDTSNQQGEVSVIILREFLAQSLEDMDLVVLAKHDELAERLRKVLNDPENWDGNVEKINEGLRLLATCEYPERYADLLGRI